MKIAVDICIPKVTEEEMECLSGEMKVPGDRREGQILCIYDRIHKFLKIEMMNNGIDLPPLLNQGEIDRYALTYFNSDKEVYSTR